MSHLQKKRRIFLKKYIERELKNSSQKEKKMIAVFKILIWGKIIVDNTSHKSQQKDKDMEKIKNKIVRLF